MDVVGLAASVAQLLQLGYIVVARIRQFKRREAPFTDIALRLPLLLNKIEEFNVLVENQTIPVEKALPLKQALDGCKRQVDSLNSLLTRISPETDSRIPISSDSKLKKGVKVIKSVYKEKEVIKIQKTLQSYETTLNLFFTDFKTRGEEPAKANRHKLFYEVPAIAADRFVGRKDVLKEIDVCLDGENLPASMRERTAVLVGLGGQGKTQLALKYGQMCRSTHSVIHLDAFSPKTLRRSFKRLVNRIAGVAFDTIESATEKVYRVLDDAEAPYIVILDTFDRPKEFDNILEYLPSGCRAKILITSRNQSCCTFGKEIPVSSMSVKDAVELLLDRTATSDRSSNQYEHAQMIVEELGGLPLAIEQASAYIKARDLPLEAFMEQYSVRKNFILQRTPAIWNYGRNLLDSETRTHLSVSTTWELSFDELGEFAEEKWRNERILTVAAFVDFTHVGQTFFEAYFKYLADKDSQVSGNVETPWSWDHSEYQDAVVLFRDVSLVEAVQFHGTHTTFSLHPLVAEWLRSRLDPSKRLSYVNEVANTLRSFARDFLFSNKRLDFAELSEMQSHLDRLADSKGLGQTEQHQRILSMQDSAIDLSRFYLQFGRYDEAESFARTCLMNASDTVQMAAWRYLLGDILMHQGSLLAADQELQRALELIERVYIRQHAETLRIIDTLAFCRYAQARLQDAESFYTIALEERREPQGLYDIEGLNAVRMLGEIYRRQKKFDLSMKTLDYAFRRHEEVCGPDHFRTLMAVSSLATLHRDQGSYQKAQEMFEEAFEGFKKVFGLNNRSTSGAKMKIGFVLEDQGFVGKAKKCYVSALRHHHSAEEDFDCLSPGANLAQVKRLMKDFNYENGILSRAMEQASFMSKRADEVINNIVAALDKEIEILH